MSPNIIYFIFPSICFCFSSGFFLSQKLASNDIILFLK